MIVQALAKCSFDRNNIQFYIEYNHAFFFPATIWKKLLSYDAENELP